MDKKYTNLKSTNKQKNKYKTIQNKLIKTNKLKYNNKHQ